MERLRVGVFDENEVFRRGVGACLRDHDDIVVVVQEANPVPADIAVAVTSPAVARLGVPACPIVVCTSDPADSDAHFDRRVAAVLPRSSLQVPHLLGAVRAVGAGLRLDSSPASTPRLDRRGTQVLSLLSEGASTADVSATLGYSVRTIKGVISDVLGELDARTRAEAVATAVRLRII